MKVAYYEVGKGMAVRECDGSLEAMQQIVGGPIETIAHDKIAGLIYVCNENGKILPGCRPNRRIYDGADILCGDFFVAKIAEDEIVGLDEEDIYHLMAADMTVEQIIELDNMYRELCRENNHLNEIIEKAKETLEKNHTIYSEEETNSKAIKILYEILNERLEKK